jgi:hypothetical protein
MLTRLAVLLTGQRYEDALREYNKAQELGIERAAQCIRNASRFPLPERHAGLRRHETY